MNSPGVLAVAYSVAVAFAGAAFVEAACFVEDGFAVYPVAALFVGRPAVHAAGFVGPFADRGFAEDDFVAGGFGFAGLFPVPCAFAYFFLMSANLFDQRHLQTPAQFLLACRLLLLQFRVPQVVYPAGFVIVSFLPHQ